MAGILAAVANNGIGAAGVSYNAKVVPIKVANKKGEITNEALCKAYDYLLSQVKSKGIQNLRVINMSLGYYSGGVGPSALKAKIADAKKLGIFTVCSAGNDASNKDNYSSNTAMKPHYPSSFDDCVSVAALKSSTVRAEYSAYGEGVDIAAPGSGIYSTHLKNGYATLSGTSMAAPVVSGIAALLYAYSPSYSVNQVKDLLYKSASDLTGSFNNAYGRTISYGSGKDIATGYGMINAAAALELAVNRSTQTSWKRIGGKTLFETGRLAGAEAFSKTSSAIIVRSGSFYDSLFVASLAGKLNAPVLFTDPSSLSQETITAIRKLGVTKVVIVGGTSAIAPSVENKLKTLVNNVSRVSGNTHLDTCMKVYQQLGTAKSKTAIVAYGYNYPDALAVGAFSFASRSPVFLTQKDGTLRQDAVSAIKAGGFSNVLIVGGTSVVKDSVRTQLSGGGRKILRLAGSDQYATCASIAKWESGKMPAAAFQPSTVLGITNVVVANGSSYTDSLCAASSAGKLKAPVLLCGNSSAGLLCASSFVKPFGASIKKGLVIGGRSVVSSGTMYAYMKAAG